MNLYSKNGKSQCHLSVYHVHSVFLSKRLYKRIWIVKCDIYCTIKHRVWETKHKDARSTWGIWNVVMILWSKFKYRNQGHLRGEKWILWNWNGFQEISYWIFVYDTRGNSLELFVNPQSIIGKEQKYEDPAVQSETQFKIWFEFYEWY